MTCSPHGHVEAECETSYSLNCWKISIRLNAGSATRGLEKQRPSGFFTTILNI